MSLIPRQVDADDEVLAYWKQKRRLTRDEIAALAAGINPFVWKDDKRLGCSPQVSASKAELIQEILTIIEHRGEPHLTILATAEYWQQFFKENGLPFPATLVVAPPPAATNTTVREHIARPEEAVQRERNTLLKIVLGMARDAYGYDPSAGKKNPATGKGPDSIHAALLRFGLEVSDDSIRKYLREAEELKP